MSSLGLAARAPGASSIVRRAARVALRADARQLFLHDWRRSLGGEPALPDRRIQRVAVVCAGNICRSPSAAALLARARTGLAVASYGLAAAEGEPADPRARVLAREWGCDLESHRTRPLRDEAAQAADLLLAMDAVQGREVARRWPAVADRVRLLGDYLPVRPFAIVDPWAHLEPVWRDTYARLAEAVRRLDERLEGRA